MPDPAPAYAQALDQLRARAEAAERERDELRACTDFEERTGPVAFERNQLRDENVKLRDEVATLAALCKLRLKHSTEHAAEAERLKRSVAALKAVAHAIVNAVAKGAP